MRYYWYVDLCVFVIWNRVRNELSFWLTFFPECVARVPVSLWGFGQPFAHVRNRSRELATAVPMVSSATGVTFGGFTCRAASFRVAGVALRYIQTCFVTCRKSFCVAGAILLRRFQKMSSSFRGRRSTLDLSCCVFFANLIVTAASSGDKVQIPWQAWHFVRCAENRRKLRTKHRFWGSKFWGSQQNS